MKHFALLLAAAAFLSVSCQRIPPSVSIPGYEQKKAAEEKVESRILGTSDTPPTFFPGKENE